LCLSGFLCWFFRKEAGTVGWVRLFLGVHLYPTWWYPSAAAPFLRGDSRDLFVFAKVSFFLFLRSNCVPPSFLIVDVTRWRSLFFLVILARGEEDP